MNPKDLKKMQKADKLMEAQKSSAQIVATKKDVRETYESEEHTHNIFEVGDYVIADCHADKCKDGRFGWESKPVYDRVTGNIGHEIGFAYTTEDSPKGIHPTRLFPVDKKYRIKLFGIEFIHHSACELVTVGVIFYVIFLNNPEYKVIGKTYRDFRLPVNVSENIEVKDLNKLEDEKIIDTIWLLKRNGFNILHWHINPGAYKAIQKMEKDVATKEIPSAVATEENKITALQAGDFFYTNYSDRIHRCEEISEICFCKDLRNNKSTAHYHIIAHYLFEDQSYFGGYIQQDNRIISVWSMDQIIPIKEKMKVKFKYLKGLGHYIVWKNHPESFRDNILLRNQNSRDECFNAIIKKNYDFEVFSSDTAGAAAYNNAIELNLLNQKNKKKKPKATKKDVATNGKRNKVSDPLKFDSELSKQGLEKLLPENPKKGLSKLLNIEIKSEIIKPEPRVDMFKFRLSKHTRLMISKLTIAMNFESNADMIHAAIKELAAKLPEEFTQEQLDQII